MLRPEILAVLLESAPDALLVVDEAGLVEFASRQISSLLGYTPEELCGRSMQWLLPERFRKVHVDHRQDYVRSARVRPMGAGLDLYALRKDGTELPVEISLSPIHDGSRLLVAAALRDVTGRKRIQMDLELARESADRANQAKGRFLATASHDLRQPLQTLSLLNGTLRRVVKDPVATEAVEQQGLAIEAMSHLLNALLDISKLESGAIHPDPTDFTLTPLFEELHNEFAGLAEGKGLELRVEQAGQRVRSDRLLVGQILRNLLSNAIKYTPRGWVELRATTRSAAVSIEVADTGVGIPKDQLPYIYDEFYQVGVASNATRNGYGLGLAIVHRLVSLLGLTLDVRSDIGGGSVFTLELPAGAPDAAISAPDARHGPRAERCSTSQRILLVDDDPGVRNSTRMLLDVEGFQVASAASLDEAIQKAKEDNAIDLLITDFHLTDRQTGLDVIAALRATVREDLKAILISGDTSSTIRDRKIDPRVRLVSKPVRADELLASVREMLLA